MPSSTALRHLLTFLGLGLLSACANQTEAQNKQLREFNERLQRLQATTDRLEERVSGLEAAQRNQAARPVNLSSPASVPSDLPLVKMSPAGQPSSGEPKAAEAGGDEPRTLIVGEGSRVEARPANDGSATPASSSRGKASSDKKNSGRTESGSKTP